jgi:hypothetical protein
MANQQDQLEMQTSSQENGDSLIEEQLQAATGGATIDIIKRVNPVSFGDTK